MNLFFQSLVNGLVLASVYALVALGLTLVFGVLDIVNFAQGQLLLVSAYLLYGLTTKGFGYWEAVPVVVVGAAAIGYGLDATLFARVRATPINGLLISIGLIGVVENLIQRVWGPNQYQVHTPISTVVSVGSVDIAGSRLLVIGVTLGILVLLALFLRFTRPGIALRAVAQHADAAALMGISVERSRHIAFAASTVLASLGGVLLAALFPISPSLSDSPLLKGFIVLILGGAGSPVGAVLGAMILGVSESFGITYWSPSGTQVLEFVLLIAVLFVRPTGLIKTSHEVSL
jgi:branched-chain amino acid transport system permease protein